MSAEEEQEGLKVKQEKWQTGMWVGRTVGGLKVKQGSRQKRKSAGRRAGGDKREAGEAGRR
jgi:hypothetical protein